MDEVKAEPRDLQIGDAVIYHDEKSEAHNALVTVWWGPKCWNLLYISSNENEKDQYGRQIKRESSVTHASISGVHGRYFRFADEQANEYAAPLQA